MFRKKNLLFAVFLNLLFFLGVTFFVSRQLSKGTPAQSPMSSWLAKAALHVASLLHNDRDKMNAHKDHLATLKQLEQKKKYAAEKELSLVFESDGKNVHEIIGSVRSFPFPQSIFNQRLIGVYRSRDQLFFSYFTKETPSTIFSIGKPLKSLTETLAILGIDLSFVEDVDNQKLVIYSSLPEGSAQDLLSQIDFEKEGASIDADLHTMMNSSFLVTISQQKYLALVLNLAHLADANGFRQKAVYTIPLPHYEAISLTELCLYIWTFFCISIALTFLVYFKQTD